MRNQGLKHWWSKINQDEWRKTGWTRLPWLLGVQQHNLLFDAPRTYSDSQTLYLLFEAALGGWSQAFCESISLAINAKNWCVYRTICIVPLSRQTVKIFQANQRRIPAADQPQVTSMACFSGRSSTAAKDMRPFIAQAFRLMRACSILTVLFLQTLLHHDHEEIRDASLWKRSRCLSFVGPVARLRFCIHQMMGQVCH